MIHNIEQSISDTVDSCFAGPWQTKEQAFTPPEKHPCQTCEHRNRPKYLPPCMGCEKAIVYDKALCNDGVYNSVIVLDDDMPPERRNVARYSRWHKDPSKKQSGVPGVVWNKTAERWVAQFYTRKKRLTVKVSPDLDEAVMARLEAEKKYGWDITDSMAAKYCKDRGLV